MTGRLAGRNERVGHGDDPAMPFFIFSPIDKGESIPRVGSPQEIRMPSIYVATPTSRPWYDNYIISLMGMGEAVKFEWGFLRSQPIDFSRNFLTKHGFLKSQHDFILYADSDASWSPEGIARLIERNLPVVCGTFFLRKIPPIPAMGPYGSVDVDGKRSYYFGYMMRKILERFDKLDIDPDTLTNEYVLDKSDDDLVEIDGCGGHFVLVRRDVIEGIKEPWFRFTTESAGEDFYFCERVRDAGFKIYADLSVYIGHIAGENFNLGLKEFLMFFENNPKAREQLENEMYKV